MDKLTVSKFNGHDFAVWKFQMMGFLEYHGLLEIVDGTTKRPASGDTTAWDKLDKKARFYIGLSLESVQVRQVMNLKTAAQMWTRLESLYELKNPTSKHLLLQRFFEYKMDKDTSVAQHVAKIEEMARQLEDLGHKQEEATLITKVLHSLPESFRNLISAWDSVPEEEQTMTNLLPRLMKEELLNKGMAGLHLNDVDTGSALYSNGKRSQNNKSNNYIRKSNDKSKDQNSSKKFNGRCHNCGKYGHRRSECRVKEKNRNDSQTNIAVSTQEPNAFTAERLASTNWNDIWIADSGASYHMTAHKEWFVTLKPLEEGKITIRFGNGDLVSAKGIGRINAKSVVNGQSEKHTLNDVLFVPEITRNLFSIGAATGRGVKAEFTKDELFLKIKGKTKATGKRITDSIYRMDIEVVINTIEVNIATNEEKSLDLWHARLGHANIRIVNEMAKNNNVIGMQCNKSHVPAKVRCEACILGKQCRKTFPTSITRAEKPGELIHIDICGPMSTPSIGGSNVMAVFVDDYSGMVFVKPLKSKADILSSAQDVIAKASASGHKVKRIRTDNAKEFKSKDFAQIARKHNITQEFSTEYCPEQNGRVERQNRTIVEMARTLLAAAELPLSLWGEASNTAALIRNLLPLDRLDGHTPWEAWYGERPDISFLRIFGSKAYALIEGRPRHKFAQKSEKLILVGFEPQQKAYRLWEPGTRRVAIRRNVDIIEPDCQQRKIITEEESEASSQETTNDKENYKKTEDYQEESADMTDKEFESDRQHQKRKYEKRIWKQDPVGIATRTRRKTTSAQAEDELKNDDVLSCLAYAFSAEAGPSDINEALNSSDRNQWEDAMADELKSLEQNKTWDLVELPSDRRAIKNKWIYKIKTKPDGTIDRYKARLVVKGCSQKANIDYTETFSPVARFESIRILISAACANDYEIYQFDIKTAFLYGDLEEDVYMEQPEGFNDGSGRVCKLRKSLYGLKQAPRQWNTQFDKFLHKFGLIKSQNDPCIYVAPKRALYLALYVDDGLVIGKSIETIKKLLDTMNKEYETTYLEAKCYLGIEIERDRKARKLRLHQLAYIRAVLKKFEMENCNPVGVPAESHQVLTRNEDENGISISTTDRPYRQLIGSLMYLAVGTRADIAFAVSTLSQFLENPSELHWKAAKRVLRYLAGTCNMGIEYRSSNMANILTAYSDADYGTCSDTRKSISGVILILNNGPVIWFSRKQGVVATSTTYAEYIAVYDATKEIVWTRRVLQELGLHQVKPTTLYCDNMAAEQLVKNPTFHRRTKHFDIKFHYTRDIVKQRDLLVEHIASNEQLADILTKPLTREKFETNRLKISVN